MNIKAQVAGAFFIGATFMAAPTVAQTFTVDTAAISAACSASAAACQAVVAAQVARLRAAGLTPAAINAQLGVIAGTAITAAASLPPAQRVQLAATIRSVASASTNPAQVQALQTLASDLEAGSDVDLAAVASSLSAN